MREALFLFSMPIATTFKAGTVRAGAARSGDSGSEREPALGNEFLQAMEALDRLAE